MEEKNQIKKPKKPNGVRYASYVYIAMAVCVVTVLAVSIYTMSYEYGDFGTISLAPHEISKPKPDVSKSDNNNQSEKPVGGEESGVVDTIDPIKKNPTFVSPLKGAYLKGYAMDSLVFSKTMKDYRVHSGIDIAAPLGTAVNAYSDGIISAIEDNDMMGKCIYITHEYGVTSVYMNLSKTIPETIKVGASVKAGDIIGAVGCTACEEINEDPHLHFELILDGENIDPEKELKSIKK
ncbi:MAG: M23 family metallopeptidase [Clostridia bacterium]